MNPLEFEFTQHSGFGLSQHGYLILQGEPRKGLLFATSEQPSAARHHGTLGTPHTYLEKRALRSPGQGAREEAPALVLAVLAHHAQRAGAAVSAAARGARGPRPRALRVHPQRTATTGDTVTAQHAQGSLTAPALHINRAPKWTVVSSR